MCVCMFNLTEAEWLNLTEARFIVFRINLNRNHFQ